ncbi:MAG: hypothetical protein IIB19_04085 [Chloroflexi bacterium]|nr:hypothetical protein [Chloroflexota bacterium]
MSKLADHIKDRPSRRDPPYRPAMTIDAEERAELDKKLGGAENYELMQLREMVQADPSNLEFKKALVSGIASAEFAGVDAFSRKVCEWQDWDVPSSLIMAIARQTWDEVRHAKLATGVLESYGGKIGEYPDTLAGGAGGAAPPPASQQSTEAPAGTAGRVVGGAGLSDPIMMLSAVNVSLEGGALTLFKETSNLGKRIGDPLLERCFDYNWADEVTHTTIGDFFIKLLAEKNPETEQKALRVHGMSEFGRSRLSGDQTEELKEFFAEEMQRAQAALGGNGQAEAGTAAESTGSAGYHQ